MAYVQKCPDMKTGNYQNSVQGTREKESLADVLKESEETCKNCNPLTPTTCVTSCKIWRLKNELRKLCEKVKNSSFMRDLLNALKNKRRLQVLEIISKGRYSLPTLQKELKKLGYHHSQQTIAEEYIAPLTEVGLAEEDQDRYHATVFGHRLTELIKNFHDIGDILPPHSECYEETALCTLLNEPKTHEDLEGIIPAKSVARVLNRLQTAGLIETAKENNYVFYFRTKRDSNNAKFSPTERRIYENISADGICARGLAEKTGISLRRTYKYLRRLRGKKMVFTRKRPKSYALTAKGVQTALTLEGVRNLAAEVLGTAAKYFRDVETRRLPTLGTSYIALEKKVNEVIPLTTSRTY